MENRYNFYKEIHKGLRSLLHALVERAGQTDFTDQTALESLTTSVRDGFSLLAAHGHHENAFIGPELERLLPELARRINDAHGSHDPEMAQLSTMLEEIDAQRPDAAVLGHRFVVALSRFAAELTLHMAEEEQGIMPALWSVLSDDELLVINRRLVASIPPDEMGRNLRWMIPALNTPERVWLFSSIRATAPRDVFEGTRELARKVLSPDDDKALSDGLAAAA